MSRMLDERTAYLAMFEFLRRHYERTGHPDEIGSLLGSLSLLNDEESADPASMQDWRDAIECVLKSESSSEGYRDADFRLEIE